MARVHFVKAARKDYPDAGIKKGESYYWWEFRYGGTHKSKERPKPSQLTQSEFLSQAYALNERIEELSADNAEDLKSEVEDICSEIRSLGEEQADKISNMPDSLQEGPTGEMLQNRADACEEWADNLEQVDLDIDEPTEDDAISALDIGEPTMEELETDLQNGTETLDEGQTKEEKLEDLVDEYRQSVSDKLEELKTEYEEELGEKIAELQAIQYEGE